MPNEAGRAYGLNVLCPIRHGSDGKRSYASITRDYFQKLQLERHDHDSPMARVPNTYLCRFFVLNNVDYQGKPAELDTLKSSYLVFVAEIHGERDAYLEGMWKHASDFVREGWAHCVGFEGVNHADHFIGYMARCQVETTLYFNGSTDDPLAEQLKALYLKQEFSKFAFASVRKSAAELRDDFKAFVARTRPRDLSGPTWRPGAPSLDVAVVDPSKNEA